MPNNYGREDFEGFTYLDYNNLAVSWNIARGAFCSPSELPPSEYNKSYLSIATAGMLSNSTATRLKSELAIDSVRLALFPECVSRLSGFFVFDEVESVARFWDCNSWGGHFSDQYLSDVGVSATRSTRVDSNWISHIVSTDGGLKEGWRDNTIKYWRGEACPNSAPIWERIVEGYLTIWSPTIRQEAVLEIQAVWPNSLKLLHYSCLCAAYGSLDGIIFPYLLQESASCLRITYISRMVQAQDRDFLEAIIENAKQMPSIEVSLNEGVTNDDAIYTPNLTPLNIVLTSEDNGAFADFVKLVNPSN